MQKSLKKRRQKWCFLHRIITSRAGLHLVVTLNELLDITGTIDLSAPPIKRRKRGLSLGSLMLSIAETMLAGGDLLCDLGFAA